MRKFNPQFILIKDFGVAFASPDPDLRMRHDQLFRSKFMVPSGLPRPVPVIVKQFTKEHMSKVIADKLKERQMRDDLQHEKEVQWEDEVRENLDLMVFLK